MGEAFSEFAAKRNRKDGTVALVWKHNLQEVKSYELYKGEGEKGASLWKVIRGFEQGIQDPDAKRGTPYEYMIRAVLASGKTGAVAKVKIQ